MVAEFFLGTQISNELNQEERIERLLLSWGSFNFFLMNKSHLKFHSLKGKNWKKLRQVDQICYTPLTITYSAKCFISVLLNNEAFFAASPIHKFPSLRPSAKKIFGFY